MSGLVGKVAVVTGASSGIGKGIALSLADAGAAVVAVARSDRLDTVVGEIRDRGGTAESVRCDVSDEGDVVGLFERIDADWGRVDVLVNSAGVLAVGPVSEMALEEWQRVLDVNLTGTFLCLREAFSRMKRVGGGRILNIGSISAQVPRSLTAAYAASKYGVVGLSRTAAIEGRAYGIAVACLHPGNVATEMRRTEDSDMNREPMMSVTTVADLALTMLDQEPDTLIWELVALPLQQDFLGRG